MALNNPASAEEFSRARFQTGVYPEISRVQASAMSWGAVLAGAAGAAALSLILLLLGTGLGLSLVSPWASNGMGAKTFGVSTILWVTFMQLFASGLGGYLAGRLRTKWVEVHTDEVYFRDTAHGFMAWAVATLATAALLTSVTSSIVSGGAQAGAAVVGSVASTTVAATSGAVAASASSENKSNRESGPMGYFVDSLLRKDRGAPPNANPQGPAQQEQATAGTSAEVTRILMNSVRTGALPEQDLQYVGQVVAQRTGISQQDAEKRISKTYARMQTKLHNIKTATKNTADKARKASAYAALWLSISLLIGAFVASWAATYGGRRRDA